MSKRVLHLCGLALLTGMAQLAVAQTPVADAVAAVSPAAAASVPADAASSVAPVEAPPSCAKLSARAMAADLKAVTAQSQNKGLDQLVQLFDAAISIWTQAAERCDGHGRERAQRNLADDTKQRTVLAERLTAGSQCELSHRDASSLQEMGRRAFGERQWNEAASLYRKAETLWDLAAEQCTGSQQELAAKRREQAAIDAHNAEFCAPWFDRAREQTQKFRAAAGLTPADKQQQLQIGETLWREATAQCKGNAAELARNNAQALARERGTPWVAAALPSTTVATKPATPKIAAQSGASPNTQPATANAAPPIVAVAPAAGTTVGLLADVAAVARVPVAAEPPPPPKEMDVLTGDTRYKGQFVRQEGQVVTGTGRVEWSNGDVYIGPLVRNQRHGKGEFIWANGQRYKGDWVNDRPIGQGVISFANGNQFEGEVVDGQPEGLGQMIYASGDQYKGTMRQGLPHGRGLYVWINGQRFDGDWVDNNPQGRGALRFANGNLYEGQVQAGKPQGQGRLQLTSGDAYEGGFEQGKLQGHGVYRWKNGDRYEGAWQVGRKHGEGTFFWSNGDRWEGRFQDDAQTEDGVLYRKEDMPADAAPTGSKPR